MAVSARGRQASTSYRVIRRYAVPSPVTLVEAELATGRTHQVRVHLAAIGHPVIGDDRYGLAASRPKELRGTMTSGRYFLHAHQLEIEHPDDGRMIFTSPLPADLEDVLQVLSIS